MHPVAVVLASLAAAPAPADYASGPVPAWVVPLPVPTAPLAAEGRADARLLLVDRQIRVGSEAERYYHFARQILSSAGVQTESELHFEVDPGQERLVLHHVTVHRGGTRIDALDLQTLKVVQQEEQLDRHLYNGAKTVLAFLRDIRVGDVIEYDFTLVGGNPALAGHFCGAAPLAFDVPAALVSVRLLWPTARYLGHRVHGAKVEPSVRTQGGVTEYVWTRRDVAGPEANDQVPGWHVGVAWLQLTDFASWADVARWASAAWAGTNAGGLALAAAVAEWRAKGDVPARLEAALRFVQDDVRYLGFEVGPRSLVPHSAAEVFARRFGDCKDKAQLLATIGARLGIEVTPALVNTRLQAHLNDLLPSAFAFDHAIARVRVDGRDLWVDGTTSLRRGPVLTRQPPGYGWALLVSPSTAGLERIPPPELAAPDVEVVETYNLVRNGVATLEVVTVHRGDAASSVRSRLQSRGRVAIEKSDLNYYAEHDPSIRLAAPLQVLDDDAADMVTTTEKYELPEVWHDGARTFEPWLVLERLETPKVTRRTAPFALDHPLWVKHDIDVVMPQVVSLETSRFAIEDEAFIASAVESQKGDRLHLAYELRSRRDHVRPEATAKYVEAVHDARRKLGYTLSAAGASAPHSIFSEHPALMMLVLGVGVMGFATLRGGSYVLGRVRRRRVLSRSTFGAGEQAATALPVANEAALFELVAHQRCACRARGSVVVTSESEARFGDSRVRVVEVECRACGHRRTIYASVGTDAT